MEIMGIDVSKYQNAIDWPKVAASGIHFAFVRVGWAGYEGGIDEGLDPCFARNMTGAAAAGLAVGAYVYSYCKTPAAARRAAREAAALLAPYRLTMPLVFDIEDAATYKALGRAQSSAVAAAMHRAAMSISGTKARLAEKSSPSSFMPRINPPERMAWASMPRERACSVRASTFFCWPRLRTPAKAERTSLASVSTFGAAVFAFCGAKLRRGSGGRLKVGRWSRAL